MKKLLGWMLVLMLLCGSAALAEDVVLNPDDFTTTITEKAKPDASFNDASFAAGKDTVTRDGNSYTVDDGNIKYTMDMSRLSSVMCLMQDMMASFESYLRFNDPNDVHKFLLDNDIHYTLIDVETNLWVYIYNFEPDSMSQMVGSFTALSDANKQIVASRLASNTSIVKAGNYDWVQYSKGYVTIYNGQYVVAQIDGGDDVAGDFADTLNFISSLTLQ